MTILMTGGDKPLGGWQEQDLISLEDALWAELYGSPDAHAWWCRSLEDCHDVSPDCNCR